jgi:hypothetical protein
LRLRLDPAIVDQDDRHKILPSMYLSYRRCEIDGTLADLRRMVALIRGKPRHFSRIRSVDLGLNCNQLSASFFTRSSTGRPVFSLAFTAACAAALRTSAHPFGSGVAF